MTEQYFVLRCKGCQDPVVLPRRSPLGRYGVMHYEPNGMWPLQYLCKSCGLLSELKAEGITREDWGLDQHPGSENLWCFSFSWGRGNSERHAAIWTKGLSGGAQKDVIGNVLGRTGLCTDFHAHALRNPLWLCRVNRLTPLRRARSDAGGNCEAYENRFTTGTRELRSKTSGFAQGD